MLYLVKKYVRENSAKQTTQFYYKYSSEQEQQNETRLILYIIYRY